MNNKLISALLVSLAANLVFADLAVPPASFEKKPDYKCQNNSCKGKADCMGFGNDSCQGNNECKGHGILNAKNKVACTKKHGLWIAKK